MGANNSCEISRLPVDCLSRIISLTSPIDACRCSVVSTFFRSAAAADVVWEHFLPADLDNILSQTLDKPVFVSKKDLYFHLSNEGILVDDGKMILSLDRLTGAKICMLSTRAVDIIWGWDVRYWQYVPNHDSRFSEVAQLMIVWWLELRITLSCKNLTPKTRYAAYFIFKLEDDSNGFDLPIEANIAVGDQETQHKVCLQPRNDTARHSINNPIRYPQVRADQWSEVEIAVFFNDGEEDDHFSANVEETRGLWAKKGLIFYGIEFRPKI
ncbi:F-box protein PP2-B11 [Rhynchospora pubera]|uniref:F-box protein PP2-B11 n=1 Tax=Rhynchospora pubera TaxID=906938 RepID=A0AAV8GT66_9POAL|nr:F-box protein PP2-B11 [Rhynchospora pubera]